MHTTYKWQYALQFITSVHILYISQIYTIFCISRSFSFQSSTIHHHNDTIQSINVYSPWNIILHHTVFR
eukprot:UN02369